MPPAILYGDATERLARDDVAERLVRIETKLDNVIAAMQDHERRIRMLELRTHWVSGAAAAFGALAGYAAAHFPKF